MARRRRKYHSTTEMKHLIRETSTRLERNKETQEKVREGIHEAQEKLRDLAREGSDLDPERCERMARALEKQIAELREREAEAMAERMELLASGHELLEDIERGKETGETDLEHVEDVSDQLHNKRVRATTLRIVRSCEARVKLFADMARTARRALED